MKLRRLLVVCLVLLAASCGAEGIPATSSNTDAFSLRVVLATSEPPCDSARDVLPEVRAGRIVSCHRLGPVESLSGAVEGFERTDAEPVDVTITLSAAGARELLQLTTRNIGKRIAIVSYGVVLNAPTVQQPIADGRIGIQDVSEAVAERIGREIFPGAPPDPSKEELEQIEANSDRSYKICNERPPPLVRGQPLLIAVAHTASEITEVAIATRGRSLPPWDSLPADHLVAGCSYESLDPEPGTTTCPDGDLYSLAVPEQYYVDEQGRWTRDEIASLMPEDGPC